MDKSKNKQIFTGNTRILQTYYKLSSANISLNNFVFEADIENYCLGPKNFFSKNL